MWVPEFDVKHLKKTEEHIGRNGVPFRPICSSVFFKCFTSNSGTHTEPGTEPFIWSSGVDCSSSFNHDRIQLLSHSKYSLLFLPVVGTEPATSRGFNLEALSNQTPHTQRHMSWPDINKGFISKFYVGSRTLYKTHEEAEEMLWV